MSHEDMREDMREDMQKFSDFLQITQDFAEHWQRASSESAGVKTLDFILHVASPILFPAASGDGTIFNITHISDDGLKALINQVHLPLLFLTEQDKEELLKCEGISEELKARIQEVNV